MCVPSIRLRLLASVNGATGDAGLIPALQVNLSEVPSRGKACRYAVGILREPPGREISEPVAALLGTSQDVVSVFAPDHAEFLSAIG